MSSMVHSEIQKLYEMVDYQDGTIVSKSLINKDTGTVTLLRIY